MENRLRIPSSVVVNVKGYQYKILITVDDLEMVDRVSQATVVSQTMELADESLASGNNIGIIATINVDESKAKESSWDADIEPWYVPRYHQV